MLSTRDSPAGSARPGSGKKLFVDAAGNAICASERGRPSQRGGSPSQRGAQPSERREMTRKEALATLNASMSAIPSRRSIEGTLDEIQGLAEESVNLKRDKLSKLGDRLAIKKNSLEEQSFRGGGFSSREEAGAPGTPNNSSSPNARNTTFPGSPDSDESGKKRITEQAGDAFADDEEYVRESMVTMLCCGVWDLVLAGMEYCVPAHARGPASRYGINFLVIHPENRVKRGFDLFMALAALYISIVTPMKVTFQINPAPLLDLIVDLMFLLDVILQFLQGYFDRGFPVLELRYIAKRYASSWMLIDVIASTPFERILTRPGEETTRWFAVLSLLKVVRLVRLSRLLQSFQLFSSKSFRVLLSLGAWVLLAHWYACTWFAIGWQTHMCAGGSYTRTWISDLWPQLEFDNCTAASEAASGTAGRALPVAASA